MCMMLTLRARMHDHLGHHSKQEEFEETERETETSPIVAVFHYVETIAFEVNLAVEIHLMECFHRYSVLARVSDSVVAIMKVQVLLHGSARVPGLFVLTGRYGGSDGPECHQNWDGGKDCDEQGRP
jgi:hypothetical protein